MDGLATNGIACWTTNHVSDYTVVSAQTAWGRRGETSWYVVTGGVVNLSGVTCNGRVNLILCPGARLTVAASSGAGIATDADGAFTVYGQPGGGGELIATGSSGAGIGGIMGGGGNNITINGGTVTATGGANCAGIGSGFHGHSNTIVINGGSVTAIGGSQGAGIGGGIFGTGSNITVNDGRVTATGSGGGHGIGSGLAGEGVVEGGVTNRSSNIRFNGGVVTATGGASAYGVCGTGVFAADSVSVLADTVTPPEQSIEHSHDLDLARNSDFLKRYVVMARGDVASPHSITVLDVEDGVVTASADSALPGERVRLTVTPDDGVVLDYLLVRGTRYPDVTVGLEKLDDATYIFTMPRISVTVSAEFCLSGTHKVRIATNECGVVSAERRSFARGEIVTLTGTPTEAGYGLYAVTVVRTDDPSVTVAVWDAGEGKFAFEMPDCGVTVSSEFAITYRYAVYNTENEPKSGIKEWKMGKISPSALSQPGQGSTQGIGQDITWGLDARYPTYEPPTETWLLFTGSQTVTGRIVCYGNVHVILADGATLNAAGGITVAESVGNGHFPTLTIHGQGKGDGALIASTNSPTASCAGIGGAYFNTSPRSNRCFPIVIHGGHITAMGGDAAAGIGGGQTLFNRGYTGLGSGEVIVINGGRVTATGGSGSAGIGGGRFAHGEDIVINGGTVVAEGGADDACGVGSAADCLTKPSTNIHAAANVRIRAGEAPSPTEEVAHAADTDLATVPSFRRRYVVAVEEPIVSAITVLNANHGSVAANKVEAAFDSPVVLTTTPDPDCFMADIVIRHADDPSKKVDVTRFGDGRCVFTMPPCAVTVCASFCVRERIASAPAAVEHATCAVLTNGVASADGTVWKCQTATAVYTADDGYRFADGTTVSTNALDTTVSPAVCRSVPSTPKPTDSPASTEGCDPDEALSLGDFNFVTKTFKDAKGLDVGPYRQCTIMLAREVADGSVELPTAFGYELDSELSTPYSFVVNIAGLGKTAAEIAWYLRQVVFNDFRQQRVRVILSAQKTEYRTFYFEGTGHFYQYVPVPYKKEYGEICGLQFLTWHTSYNQARNMQYAGRQGYLATITSLEEDAFVYKASAGKVGWLGGTCQIPTDRNGMYFDHFSEPLSSSDTSRITNHWYWACGPECGQMFFDSCTNRPAQTTAQKSPSHPDYLRNSGTNGFYFNWNFANANDQLKPEPNSPGEACLTTLSYGKGVFTHGVLPTLSTYSWNNLWSHNSSLPYSPRGSIVEFGDKPVGDSRDGEFVEGYLMVEKVIRMPVVTFDATEGEFPDGSKTNAVTQTATDLGYMLPTATPTRDGYDLKGWYVNTNDVTTVVSAGAPLLTFADHTAYAVWTVKDTVKVTVDVGDGIRKTDVILPVHEVEKHGGRGHESDREPNGHRAWENIVIGLMGDAHVGTGARQDGLEDRLTVIADNLDIPPKDTGFAVGYYLDRVTREGRHRGAVDGDIESEASTPSGLSVNLSRVVSNDYYKVRVRLVQTNEASTVTQDFEATNTLGVLKVPVAPRLTIVAVPWGELGLGDAEIKVADLVKTANLTPGDKLYVYRPDERSYQAWELDNTLIWQPSLVYNITSGGASVLTGALASDVAVPRGSGVWLERQDDTKAFYLFGQVETNLTVTTTLPAGEKWNLVGAPHVTPLDLNEQFPAPAEGDHIIIPSGNAPRNYTFEKGKWGRWVTETVTNATGQAVGVGSFRKTDDAACPPGLGFWYYKKDGTPRAINW